MTPILLLLTMAIVGWYGIGWWQRRQYAAEMVAALEAAKMHRYPVLIRSQFIGDTDVEARAQDLRERLHFSGNQYLTPDDVIVQIYHARAATGRAFVDFHEWCIMVEAQHAEYVEQWVQARRAGAGGQKFTTEAEKELHNQRPRNKYAADYGRVFEWDKVNYQK